MVRRFEEQDEDEIHDIEIGSRRSAARGPTTAHGRLALGGKHTRRGSRSTMRLREWNQYVEEFNRGGIKRPVGRPLQASEAQCSDILKMRKRGASLRGETSLGLPTVRTIVGKKAGTDRTSSRLKAAAWKRTVRTIDDVRAPACEESARVADRGQGARPGVTGPLRYRCARPMKQRCVMTAAPGQGRPPIRVCRATVGFSRRSCLKATHTGSCFELDRRPGGNIECPHNWPGVLQQKV